MDLEKLKKMQERQRVGMWIPQENGLVSFKASLVFREAPRQDS